MITIHPDRIPRLEARNGGPDDWSLICDGRVVCRGLSEYMARMLAAAPKMLEFLDVMSRREHAPARIPIEIMLGSCFLRFWRPGDDTEGTRNSNDPGANVS